MENRTDKRREPIVVSMVHSDSEKVHVSKHKSELPNFSTLPFFGLHLKSVHQKDKKTMTLCFLATLTNMFQKTFG